MDFFTQQDRARKRTGLLVFLYALAVIGVIGAVYLALAAIFKLFLVPESAQFAVTPAQALWDPSLLAVVAGGTSLLVTGGSLYKIAALSGGGHRVAEMLGGRLVPPSASDFHERRLLNVVEEMALAAGTPVPPVYLLEESGINAFAAGHTPADAVIGVTRGCVQNLSRDELQGVVAHEFSHILNGDMRLNLRLMGVLFGIMLIGITGYLILRLSTRRAIRLGARKKGGNPLPLIGLALYVIGYIGVFFASLIKAAVSRQREYLADAAAVQFTRNPDGIAGALKKIGATGSLIKHPEAEEASHLFFSNALGGFSNLFGLLATHPPLVKRIQRIDPSFDGDFSRVRLGARQPAPVPSSPKPPASPLPSFPGRALDPVRLVQSIGLVDPAQLEYAATLRDSIPADLLNLSRDPASARALVLALLLDDDPAIRQSQLEHLQSSLEPSLLHTLRKGETAARALDASQRLALAELAIPALRQMSQRQFEVFRDQVDHFIAADQRVSLFEFTLQRMTLRSLATHFGLLAPPRPRYQRLSLLREPLALILAALAHAGHADFAAAAHSYTTGLASLKGQIGDPPLAPRSELNIKQIDSALDALAQAAVLIKPDILQACAACVLADEQVTNKELNLLRLVADALDCPLPPLPEPIAAA